jgi:N-methylhydantoinase A
VRRGRDPRDFVIVAFGGGGSMHACVLARELQVPRVIVPPNPAHFSAWGMLTSDLRHDAAQTRVGRTDRIPAAEIAELWIALEGRLLATFAEEGLDAGQVAFARVADMRYAGQEHTVRVPVADGDELAQIERRFHDLHEQLYTFRLDTPIEFVNFRVTGFGSVQKPELRRLAAEGDAATALKGSRDVDFDALGRREAEVFERARLGPGSELEGPAVVEEPAASTVVFPGQSLRVDDFGNLIVDTGGES